MEKWLGEFSVLSDGMVLSAGADAAAKSYLWSAEPFEKPGRNRLHRAGESDARAEVASAAQHRQRHGRGRASVAHLQGTGRNEECWSGARLRRFDRSGFFAFKHQTAIRLRLTWSRLIRCRQENDQPSEASAIPAKPFGGYIEITDLALGAAGRSGPRTLRC